MVITLDHLRRFAVANSLFRPTTLKRALHKLGFVQADPIRTPARAQDLTLRHRVQNYRAGDLERRYPELGIEEDVFVNYGFVTNSIQALMHPRSDAGVPAEGCGPWPVARRKQAERLLEFVRERGAVHPREVDDHFAHGAVRNYWGGSSNATTHLLDAMHYRGLLRVARRESGIRIYTAHEHGLGPNDADARRECIDRLIDAAVRIYAPLPGPSLSFLLRRLRFAVPQWHGELKDGLQRAKQRLSHTRVNGLDWYWQPEEDPSGGAPQDGVRLLSPFDPVVWDRGRLSSSGAGFTVSKPTRRRPNESAATTLCRWFGGTASLAGAIYRCRRVCSSPSLATSNRHRVIAHSSAASKRSWITCEPFSALNRERMGFHALGT
jgi:uncharacterized protein YcaQ